MINVTVNFVYGIGFTWILPDSFVSWPYEEPLFDAAVNCVNEDCVQSISKSEDWKAANK